MAKDMEATSSSQPVSIAGYVLLKSALQSLGEDAPNVSNASGYSIQSLRQMSVALLRKLGTTPESCSDRQVHAVCMFISATSAVRGKELNTDGDMVQRMTPLNVFHKRGDGESLADLAIDADNIFTNEVTRRGNLSAALIAHFAAWLQKPTDKNLISSHLLLV